MVSRSILRVSVVALAAAIGLTPLLFAFPGDARAQSQMAVVFVDTDKVIADIDEGKNAHEALVKEQEKRQKDISALESQLKKLQDDLEKQAKSFSKDAIEKKAAQYQQAAAEYQQIVVKYNKALQEKEKDLYDPIEKNLKDLLRAIALRDGYDLILNKRSVPYGRKDLDITEKVIQEYNKAHPAVVKAPKTVGSAKPTPSVAPKASVSAAPAPSGKKP